MEKFWWKWAGKAVEFIFFIINPLVFLLLDFLDFIMCIFYRYVDELLEGKSSTPCYCQSQTNDGEIGVVSKTLFGRKNLFRDLGLLGTLATRKCGQGSKKVGTQDLGNTNTRWSDCGCQSCVSWMKINGGNQKLHVVVEEPSKGNVEDIDGTPTQNVIFLHGFLSSSSFWTETVFPHLTKDGKYRLFAVDLLGFGASPKPRECLYSLTDHSEMIEKSVIREFELSSFHLVAHSMGCMIALALAAKHSENLESVTLIAPPYFCSSEEDASLVAFKRLARKSLWPPSLFGAAFMSWYEHLGRCVCFLVCRNHRTWEKVVKLITRKRKLHFLLTDLTRHTHHSAWHTMHNIVCGGAKAMDRCLETLSQARARTTVVHGSRDRVVPVECSHNVKAKVPEAVVKIIADADHSSVVMGREREFASDLETIWDSVKVKG